MRKIKHASGFSLVELMVSITLGIILTFSLIEVYTGTKSTYRTQDALARLQENARFALSVLSQDIRSSGFIGCSNLRDLTPDETGVSTAMNYSATGAFWGNQSTGTDGTTVSGTLPNGVTATNRVAHTDVFLVQAAGRCSTPLAGNMANASANVTMATANPCSINNGDTVLLSNCESADLFTVTAAPGTTGNLTHTGLSSGYTTATGSEIMTFSSNTYFIGTDTSGLPALFVIDNTEAALVPVALVEGVENMQIQYGVDIDEDGIPNRFVYAGSVADWSQVTVARITLLMRTIEDLGAQATTFNVGGANTPYPAGPIRQQFVATVQLRNRSI